MKHRIITRLALIAVSLLATLGFISTTANCLGYSQTWDAAVNSTWDTVTLNWSGSAWTNGSDALFGTTGAGTVNLGVGVTANSLTFNNTGFTIAGGTLTLTGAQTVTTNADAAISSVTAGALTKAGSGTLTLSANSLLNGLNTTVTGGVLNLTGKLYGFNNTTYFVGGQVFVNAGATLKMNGWGWNQDNLGMVNSGNTVILNGGTLVVTSTGNFIPSVGDTRSGQRESTAWALTAPTIQAVPAEI